MVLTEFPDKEAYQAWADSAEYQEISKDRHPGADTVTLLIRGLPKS